MYADEWALADENDTVTLFKEAKLINAKGAGITGGDPLFVWDRTVRYIELMKNQFGESFHIHLYTSALKEKEHIQDIINAGLDEIRFHPLPSTWNNMETSPLSSTIRSTLKSDCDVGIEIPVIPSMKQEILHLVKWADSQGIQWINLNELEFSERNENALYQKGYTIKHDLSASVNGSESTARDLLNIVASMNLEIGLHYCSSSFKDGIQLTNRMKRRARSIARDFDIITGEGTIIKGIIEPTSKQDLKTLLSILTQKLHLRMSKDFIYDTKTNRIELHAELLDHIHSQLPTNACSCFIIEQYPTADGLEVERIPLPGE
jgi:pyruvate formate-lyase activating enzyme-like uncharacterized protein